MTTTARWCDFESEAPELAARVEARFRASKHHVLATVRADGSPRVSGTEVEFKDGDLVAGSMPGSRKARDLQADPRFALHANPGDGSMEGGDAKVAGLADEVTEPGDWARLAGDGAEPGSHHLFRFRLREVVLTSIHPDGDRLLIQTWRPGAAVTSFDRY